MSDKRNLCSYCGLAFSGNGYSPDGKSRYCCYGCFIVERITGSQGDEGIASWLLIRLGVGAFLAMNVMMISLLLYVQPASELGPSVVRTLHRALFALATPAVLILGGPFAVSSFREIKGGRINMDILILASSITAYGASAFSVIKGSGHVYFDTATMLLLIITLGRLMEACAKNRASNAVKGLSGMMPTEARVLKDGVEVEIPSEEVKPGDILVVRPGERFPSDGVVTSGECLVEESAFTGESIPRHCLEGDLVYGGSVNCDGFLQVKATSAGADSLVFRVHGMVVEAQYSRAPIERLAERAAGAFVPAIWLAAAATFVYWGLMRHDTEQGALSALAVMVVACPCSLGIATPIATSIAIAKSAGHGVLIRSGDVLERLHSIRKIFLDKTGTLTYNTLTVTRVSSFFEDITGDEILSWAASLETGSEHALAKAIISSAVESGWTQGEIHRFQYVPGRGVEGEVTLGGLTRSVVVGSGKYVIDKYDSSYIPDHSEENVQALTEVYVGWDGIIRGVIYFTDCLRPGSADLISELGRLGITTALISGDRPGAVSKMADNLGIGELYSGCVPQTKAEIVRNSREKSNLKTAMVGDGINDALALAEADVGIAIGSGTDLARGSGHIILLGDDLSRIPWVIKLSYATCRTIKQNLFWAFGYNLLAVVLAFCGYVHPIIAAAAMFTSSTVVLINSLKLARSD